MTQNEFDTWLEHHFSAFPVGAWLAKTYPTGPEQDAHLAHWQRTLESVSLKSCMAATDAMVDGTEDVPNGYSRHPQAIRRIAARFDSGQRETVIVDGQQTYSCPHCEDRGVRYVMSPQFVSAAVRADDYETFALTAKGARGTTVACVCPRGEVKSQSKRLANGQMMEGMIRFDATRMIEMDSSMTIQQQWDLVQERYASRSYSVQGSF